MPTDSPRETLVLRDGWRFLLENEPPAGTIGQIGPSDWRTARIPTATRRSDTA
ncbi:hypothetical protein HQ520_12320 [bacterium]|nr:hypothetical protein [bacterium]